VFSPPVTAEHFSGGIIGLRWYWILRDYNRTDHNAGLFGAESMVRGWRKILRVFQMWPARHVRSPVLTIVISGPPQFIEA
jgi:hypothetical protein